MTDAYLPPAGGVRFSQIAPAREVRYHAANARAFTVRELADAYMASYRGRDRSRAYNLAQWCELIGDRVALEVDVEGAGRQRSQLGADDAGQGRRTIL